MWWIWSERQNWIAWDLLATRLHNYTRLVWVCVQDINPRVISFEQIYLGQSCTSEYEIYIARSELFVGKMGNANDVGTRSRAHSPLRDKTANLHGRITRWTLSRHTCVRWAHKFDAIVKFHRSSQFIRIYIEVLLTVSIGNRDRIKEIHYN